MTRAFVGVGSNIRPAENVRAALRLLGRHARLLAFSTVWTTAPVARPEQDWYYNCVAAIVTNLPPLELKRDVLRAIEAELGRVRGADKFAPRPIDLDLLVYDGVTLQTAELELPDPDIAARPFLALALHELAPSLALRGVTIPLDAAAEALKAGAMRRLDAYTKALRKEWFVGHK
jgi:2-amino-4-hydroxy-6-hydroxymethyldihydropteridine diphosphokinase